MPTQGIRSIVFDCAGPAALARFWADVLGYTVRAYDQPEIDRLRARGFSVEDDPSDAGPTIWFNRVPEANSPRIGSTWT